MVNNKLKEIIYKAYILGFNTDENTITSFDDWWEVNKSNIFSECIELIKQSGYLLIDKEELKKRMKALDYLEKPNWKE